MFLLHEYRLNHWLIRCLSNRLEWVDSIWRDLDRRESSWNLCDSKLQDFCSHLFQIKNYFVLSIFWKVLFLRVFTFNFCCDMSQQDTVGEILHPDDKVEDFVVSCTVRLWDQFHKGYLWAHPSVVINVPPGYGNIRTLRISFDGFLESILLMGGL